eukprot:168981_1
MTKTNVTQVPELHTRVSRPLPHFHPQDICNHIQKLVLNNMNHQTHLAETQAIFANQTFSGQKMIDLETVVHRDLSMLVTDATLDIMFRCHDQWKNEAQHPLYEEITSKTAEEMAHVLFHYPLNSLLQRIIHENIDRSQLIASLTMEQHHENTFHIIVTETGWRHDEVHQILPILLRHHTWTRSEFARNCRCVWSKKEYDALSPHISKIKDIILSHDVQEIHHKIKHTYAHAIDSRESLILQRAISMSQRKREKEMSLFGLNHHNLDINEDLSVSRSITQYEDSNDIQIQTEKLKLVEHDGGIDDTEQEEAQERESKAYPSSLHSKFMSYRPNRPMRCDATNCNLKPVNAFHRTCDLFISPLSMFMIATEQIFAVVVSSFVAIASNMQISAIVYYIMFCLLTMQASAVYSDAIVTCTNDGYLYYLDLDIYPERDNKTEFELEISSNANNESYYDFSIYIKSNAKECVSPTYTVSYYHENITIVTNGNQPRKECIHSHKTAACPPVMDACIFSNANSIKSNGFDNISLLLPPSPHQCNASDDINPKLSIQCLDVKNYDIIDMHVLMSCSEDEPCRDKNITCLEGTNCFILCQNYRECDMDNVKTCSACYNSTFHCPHSGQCTVRCLGDRACYYAKFHGVNEYIHCVGGSVCYKAEFYGINADISCIGPKPCLRASFKYATDTDNTGHNVICDGIDACSKSDFDVYEWFRMTNGDRTEQIIVSVTDDAVQVEAISKYGNVIELFKEASQPVLWLDVCNHCTINVNSSFIDAVVTVYVLVYDDPLLFITTCIVFGSSILFFFIIRIFCSRITPRDLWHHVWYPGIMCIVTYSRVVVICVFVYLFVSTDTFGFAMVILVSSSIIVCLLLPFIFVVIVCCKYDIKSILNEHMHRREQIEPDVTIIRWVPALFIICYIAAWDPICALGLFKYTIFGIEINKIFITEKVFVSLSKQLCFICHFVLFFSAVIATYDTIEWPLRVVALLLCAAMSLLWSLTGISFWDDSMKQTYSFMKMECKFTDDEMEVAWNTSSRFIDYAQIVTDCIGTYLGTSKYIIKVVRIQQGNMILYIEYDDDNGTYMAAGLEMESYLIHRLTHEKFANYFKERIARDAQDLPIITLQGQCGMEEVRRQQVEQFVAKANERLKDVDSMMDGMKPLHIISSPDLIQLITNWILTDQKQCMYRNEIMTIIKTNNIDGFIYHIKEQEEQIGIAKYLENIIGDYINPVMMRKIGQKLEELDDADIKAQEIGELICMFPIDAINEGSLDNMDGRWVATNDKNMFIKKLQATSGMDRDDIVQIHRFLMKYYVNTDQDFASIIIDRIHQQFKIANDVISKAINEQYVIDFASLLVKLRNNQSMMEESKQLFNLCEYLVHNANGTGHGVTNYHLIDEIYKEIADILSVVGLDEWWCSECCNKHKIIKIFNETLEPNGEMMRQCIVCGCDKIKAIINALKCATKMHLLSTKDADKWSGCKLNVQRHQTSENKSSANISTQITINDMDESTPLKNNTFEHDNTANIASEYMMDGDHKMSEMMRLKQVKSSVFELDETEDIKSRYTTDIGLYGFGVNHQHHELGPHRGTMCLMDEILKTQHLSESLWSAALIKAFQKYKSYVADRDDDTSEYRSKQSSVDYNIHRGEKIAVKHILSICLYTDNSKLCTEYRSTFRRLEADKNNQDVVYRFRFYYFMSRFLFEAIEFWGNPLKPNKIVYHGLDKELLFERFSHHFHAPMSTTATRESAMKFASEGSRGILLHLTNGNKDISAHHVISQFEPNQPRFLDVKYFSRFGNEDELLFFGNSVIFEIKNMWRMRDPNFKQIPRNTLRQLNLLQRIIKGKHINWDKAKNIKSLAKKLKEAMPIIVATMEYENLHDEVDTLERYLATTERVFDDAFIASFVAWYKDNHFDRDSLVADIGEQGHKNESHFYSFLVSIKREECFELIYELFAHQKEQRIKQSKQLYYMKLLVFFTISQTEFISIHKPFDPSFPLELASQMFRQDDMDDSVLSLTKLTDLFYHVQNIQLSGLSQKTMLDLCSDFCEAVIRYSVNYERNKFKKLKSIRFKSETVNNAISSDLLKRKTKEYQKEIDQNLEGIVDVKYLFEYEANHILQFNIKQVKDLKTERY